MGCRGDIGFGVGVGRGGDRLGFGEWRLDRGGEGCSLRVGGL